MKKMSDASALESDVLMSVVCRELIGSLILVCHALAVETPVSWPFHEVCLSLISSCQRNWTLNTIIPFGNVTWSQPSGSKCLLMPFCGRHAVNSHTHGNWLCTNWPCRLTPKKLVSENLQCGSVFCQKDQKGDNPQLIFKHVATAMTVYGAHALRTEIANTKSAHNFHCMATL